MTVRNIVTIPNPILRTHARSVKSFTPELQYLISDMVETMRSAKGVGLAAPQIGIDTQLIVVEYGEYSKQTDPPSKSSKLFVVINPEIIQHSSIIENAIEACLSIPGYCGMVARYQSATIKGFNRHGRPFRLKASGWMARIFQHEIDHLEGILYTERATQAWRVQEKMNESPMAI
jgi:peptide deformylase